MTHDDPRLRSNLLAWRCAALILAATVTALGCSSSNRDDSGGSSPPPPTGAHRVLVAATDYQVLGTLATIDLDTFAVTPNVEQVSADPVPAVTGDRVVVVNRFQFDNLQLVDPENGFTTTAQLSTGNGSNPHDVVVRGDQAFVTRYEPPFNDVLVMDVIGGATIDRIDLLPFADTTADPSVLPRPDRIVEHDGLLYVTLQHFDPSFSIASPGAIVVIDPASRQVTGRIALDGKNVGAVSVLGDELYVSMSGLYYPPELSGGVARVSLDGRAATTILDDDDAGGNIAGLAVVSPFKGYVTVAKPDAHGAPASVNDVVVLDPSTGDLGATVFSCPAFLPQIGFDGDHTLVVLCRDPLHPGVVLIDVRNDQTLAGPIDTGLPPAAFAFLR